MSFFWSAMNIETKRLVLRNVEPEDAQFLADLVNNPEVRNLLGAYSLVFPVSVEVESRWIAEASKKENEAHLILAKKKGLVPMGILSIKEVSLRNGSAHLSIIIQEKDWDKGYGTEAISGVLEFMFMRLNGHRIWLRVDVRNARAIRCYEKCGFKVEGTLREDHFAAGKWQDSYIMSILRSEYGGKS